ncbi:hypothetical protein Tco_0638014 [Tanacetum coccineum]
MTDSYSYFSVGALVAEVSTWVQIISFLRSLPPGMIQSGNDYETIPEKSKCLKTSSSAQNGCFCFTKAKASTNKVKSSFTGGLQDWDLLHEDLEQIDDLDIEEMDINWQIAMIAIRMKKFYKKIGRRVRVDGKTPVGFGQKKD